MDRVRMGTMEVVIFRITEGPEFLVLQRSDSASPYPGLWQIVSGRIEKREKAPRAAMREVREETGMLPLELYNTPLANTFYDAARDAVNLSPVFAALVEASAVVILSSEHKAFQWLRRDEAISRLVWPGQKSAIQVVHDFIVTENPSRDSLLL